MSDFNNQEFAGKENFLATLKKAKEDIQKYIVDLKLEEYINSLIEIGNDNLLKKAVHAEIASKVYFMLQI